MNRGWSRVVVAATGPSFSESQATLIEGARAAGDWRVIAISDAWLRLPHADLLYACDGTWWKVVENGVVRIDRIRATFSGELWTQHRPTAQAFGLRYIRGYSEDGLTTRADAVNNGKNSGYQGINLAYLFGAVQIVLVGFDMQDDPDGKHHFFGDHPKPLDNRLPFDTCRRLMARLAVDLDAAGIDVINATERTALVCFRRASLETALC
jgi:hypothetical protein